MDAVTLRHVDKAYTSYSTEIVITGEQRQSRTRQVLKDLSVTFAAGQLTVIVGRSGCGKSTLLKLLAGKEQPDAGEISIPQGWHSAMLSPDPYVITWTNVQRNVAMACGVGKTPEERYEKAADFVRLVGLEDYADLTPMELVVIALLALLASVGTPAAPGAGAVILFTILSGVGFVNDKALLAYSLILAINRPIEMLVTSLNVVGDAVASICVAKSEGLLNEKTFNK